MKKIIVMCALAAWASWAQSAPVAEVLAVQGQASTGTSEAPRALVVGDMLEVGAALHTGVNGRVRLRFLDGSTLVVSDNATLRIERLELADGKRSAAVLWLKLGLVGLRVVPSAPGSWTVRTPSSVTAVRGTEFMVEVGASADTSVLVQSGSVEVTPVFDPKAPRVRGASLAKVQLDAGVSSARCSVMGCAVTKGSSETRVQRALDRLSGI